MSDGVEDKIKDRSPDDAFTERVDGRCAGSPSNLRELISVEDMN